MAMKQAGRQVFSSLYFRIFAPVVPIVILMALAGALVFSLGLNTVSHYANERIHEDLGRNAREIYNICDGALQSLLFQGGADNQAEARIRKGTTLGKIEEYARQNDLQVLVYRGDADDVLLKHTTLDARKLIAATQGSQVIDEINDQGAKYYARRFGFDLWGWTIVVVKDGRGYVEFVSRIRNSYYMIGAILLLVGLALVMYFRYIIHKPVRSIIASIRANGLPDYKGIYEFEFLSNVIREAALNAQQKQQQISWQAAHDALTGLINRREFEHRLGLALQAAQIERTVHSMLYLDLDQFKIVNDTCGHNAGDALLQQLAAMLKARLRQSDVLARLGGDEFGVLLEHCSGGRALQIAETLRQTVASFRFVWADKNFAVGVSIGLVTFGGSAGGEGLTVADVFSIVDGACYVAKDHGRNRIHVYRPDDVELAERKGLMDWASRISNALAENRFVLHRQKIVSLQEGGGVRYELLVRMVGQDGRAIAPMAFIPAAERYGLMPDIDLWVIRTAFAHYGRNRAELEQGVMLAVNLSGVTLSDERLLPYIREQLAANAIPPTTVCFEITETAAIAKLDIATALIQELRRLGCSFALDDFGSGMSSFGYLKNLAIDFVKIDGSFVRNLASDPIDRAMVEAINNIGHVLGIKTIAEFVETEEVATMLRAMGVDYAQGYWAGRPEPLERPDA